MKTVGIIAEYNPFHNGHLYQLQKAREYTGADYVIAAISGDFVQRGEPAIFDKYTRTRMALASGADLVLELPVCFATASAQDFAMCGVTLLDRLGTVDSLCFGSECGDLAPLTEAARILALEPGQYQVLLKKQLKAGIPYPQARAASLAQYLDACGLSPAGADGWASLLTSPNNILAIEYLKASIRRKSPIRPVTVLRKGGAYHGRELEPGNFASASALRRSIEEYACASPGNCIPEGACSLMEKLSNYIPAPALKALREEGAWQTPLFPNDLSQLLLFRLLSSQHENCPYDMYEEVSPELGTRLKKHMLDFPSFTEAIGLLKTRQYTYTRISRALLHILLGIRSEDIQAHKENDYVRYARVLGFRRDSSPLLGKIKRNSSLPLITKTADAPSILNKAALKMLQDDIYASHVYQSMVRSKGRWMENEYTKSVITLEHA